MKGIETITIQGKSWPAKRLDMMHAGDGWHWLVRRTGRGDRVPVTAPIDPSTAKQVKQVIQAARGK